MKQHSRGFDTFDMLEAATFADGHPFDLYAQLREESPVLRKEPGDDQPPYWVLSRYAEILAVSRDNQHFSSRPGFRLPERGMEMRLKPEILQAIGQNLLTFDPPAHGGLRKPLQPAFMPSSTKGLRPKVEAFADRLIAKLRDRDQVEFVSEIAAVVPIKTLCILLGIPDEDEDRIFEWTNRLVGTSDPEFGGSAAISNDTFEEVFEYGRHLIEKKRADPGEDLLSVVANLEIDGEPISDSVRDGFFVLLLAAGNETTRNSLSGAVRLMSENPDQRRILANAPNMIAAAVPEFLRLISPVIQMMRTALEDIEVGGERIGAGERVVMLYGAANTDPALFEDPMLLDISRGNANRHFAFGQGIHRCLGASIATLQLEILLEKLLAAFPDISVIGEPEYLWSNFVCGPKRMRVSLKG